MLRYIFLFIWLLVTCATPQEKQANQEHARTVCQEVCAPNTTDFSVESNDDGTRHACLCNYHESSCEVPHE